MNIKNEHKESKKLYSVNKDRNVNMIIKSNIFNKVPVYFNEVDPSHLHSFNQDFSSQLP